MGFEGDELLGENSNGVATLACGCGEGGVDAVRGVEEVFLLPVTGA